MSLASSSSLSLPFQPRTRSPNKTTELHDTAAFQTPSVSVALDVTKALISNGVDPVGSGKLDTRDDSSHPVADSYDSGEYDTARSDCVESSQDSHEPDDVDFWLQPIPDREAPSQHIEIAAAEERLFRALDTALETYSLEVTSIRRREAATCKNTKTKADQGR